MSTDRTSTLYILSSSTVCCVMHFRENYPDAFRQFCCRLQARSVTQPTRFMNKHLTGAFHNSTCAYNPRSEEASTQGQRFSRVILPPSPTSLQLSTLWKGNLKKGEQRGTSLKRATPHPAVSWSHSAGHRKYLSQRGQSSLLNKIAFGTPTKALFQKQ